MDKISFTGSPETGRAIQIAAAQTFKRVTLELGGKSPQIILADADVEAAVNGTAMGLFFNQGEVCAAGTRVLVHRSHYDDVVAALAGAAKAQVLGDPFDPATTMGALVNAKHRDRVLGYVDKGKAEGARLVAGGGRPDGEGFFVEPTIFADVDNDMTIAREEIFRPVGAVIPFDNPADAIRLANATSYGLSGIDLDEGPGRGTHTRIPGPRRSGVGQRMGSDRPRPAVGRHEDQRHRSRARLERNCGQHRREGHHDRTLTDALIGR